VSNPYATSNFFNIQFNIILACLLIFIKQSTTQVSQNHVHCSREINMCPLRAVHLNQPNCGTLLHSGHVRRGGCLPDISSSYVGEDVVGLLGYNVGVLRSRYQRFGETYCLPTLSMEAIYSSKHWYLSSNPHCITTQKTNMKTDC
jgi:hypothetical protein